METSMLLHCGCSSLFFSSNLHCTFFFQRICRPRPRCCQRSKERKAAGAAETPPTGQKQWRLAGNRRDLTWLMEHYAKRRICIGDKPPWLQNDDWRQWTRKNEKNTLDGICLMWELGDGGLRENHQIKREDGTLLRFGWSSSTKFDAIKSDSLQ